MKIIWRYTRSGRAQKQHAFINENRPTSICGIFIPWYAVKPWLEDEEGLKKREKCASCLRILANPGEPAVPRRRPAGLPQSSPEP